MSSDFFIQSTNLLAQQLSNLKGEEIYQLTSCMEPEYRQVVAVLEGIKGLAGTKAKASIEKIEPLLILLGKANWGRSELTDLGLRVGQRNYDEVTDTEITPDAKLPKHSD